MSLHIANITRGLSDLEISGVKIKDKDELKEGWDAYDCPLLCPRPNEFVSVPVVTSVSFGSGATHQMNVTYNLNYRYFHAPVGKGDLIQTWSDMVDNLFEIFYQIAVNDVVEDAIDVQIVNVTQFGVVEDGAGNNFHGCDITLKILEYLP